MTDMDANTCTRCGADWMRPAVRGPRPKFCPPCRAHVKQHDANRACLACGEVGNVRRDAATCSHACAGTMRPPPPPRPPRAAPTPRARGRADCAWCGGDVPHVADAIYCTTRCRRKARETRRRAHTFRAPHTFTWTDVMRLHLAFGRRCAYCDVPIFGDPDPDHVVPLARGGHNGIGNILPSCRACNCDKRQLLLSEWGAERVRLGKAAVTTQWNVADPRYRHLSPEVYSSSLPLVAERIAA